jgi:hypothetical protein
LIVLAGPAKAAILQDAKALELIIPKVIQAGKVTLSLSLSLL